ncbi:MAG: 2-C-methyl-D-erythritol 2,4-cyclodiphosphate synthase [Pyrinomonadaceae bacterium]
MFRIGFGTDIHRLVADRPLIIGGVTIDSPLGSDGHSDADVLLHAVTDAVLGAVALGDIGLHFPDGDPRWQDTDSTQFLLHAVGLIGAEGYSIVNLDAVVHLEMPKLRPHIDEIRRHLAAALAIGIDRVSVKAKTGESVDAVGERRAVRADAMVLVSEKSAMVCD